MADQKITEKTATTTLDDTDIVPVVTDLAGTPTTKKITVANLRTEMQEGLSGGAFVDLTDGATVVWDLDDSHNAKLLIEGTDRVLQIDNQADGDSGLLIVTQDGTGSRTLELPGGSYVEDGGLGVVTLTSAPGAIDVLKFVFDGTNYFWEHRVNFTPEAPAFTPSDLADIWGWWEPSRDTYNNGDQINLLTDQTGNSRNFTNGTADQRPIYDTDDALNGHAVADCTSTPRQLFGTDMTSLSEAHLFFVVKVVTQAGDNGLWQMSSNGDSPSYAFSDNNIYENAFRDNSRPSMGNPVASLTSWRVYEISSVTDEWIVRLDGTQQGSTQNPNTVGPTATPRIGHNGGIGLKGYFAGLYICSAKLGSEDRGNLIAYINDRFGLSAS